MDIQKEREAFEQALVNQKNVSINNLHVCTIFDVEKNKYSPSDVCDPKEDFIVEWINSSWSIWQAAKARAVPAKLVLELEKGRFKEYEFRALLRQSLRASKVTRSKLNWVHVMGMLGTGSTVAHRICEALGVNPDGTEFKAQDPAND